MRVTHIWNHIVMEKLPYSQNLNPPLQAESEIINRVRLQFGTFAIEPKNPHIEISIKTESTRDLR